MSHAIHSKAARQRLEPRRDPYWHPLKKGASLGFRRGPDTWVARYRGRDGKHRFHALRGVEEFTEAKQAAESWCDQMAGGAHQHVTRGTVRTALRAYLDFLIRGKRGKAAQDAEGKFRSCIYADPVCEVELEDVTREDFLAWRDRLTASRENQSVNRYVRQVVAALNCAVTQCGHVGNRDAWRMIKLPEEKAETGEQAIYLDDQQRARLLKYAANPVQSYLRAMYFSGGRTNEIANALVQDYDTKAHTLVLRHWKGRPAKLRARVVTLESKDKAFFRALTSNKLPTAFLLTDVDGLQWKRHKWAAEVRAAIKFANATAKPKELIDIKASAYSFRHSRIAELLQIYNVDPITVCAQTGTSLAMLEKYYWKFIPSAIKEKFESKRA